MLAPIISDVFQGAYFNKKGASAGREAGTNKRETMPW